MEEFELVAHEFSLKFAVLDATVGSGWGQVFLLHNYLGLESGTLHEQKMN